MRPAAPAFGMFGPYLEAPRDLSEDAPLRRSTQKVKCVPKLHSPRTKQVLTHQADFRGLAQFPAEPAIEAGIAWGQTVGHLLHPIEGVIPLKP